jgi:membrane protein implicated in regulation of membrane protease activity
LEQARVFVNWMIEAADGALAAVWSSVAAGWAWLVQGQNATAVAAVIAGLALVGTLAAWLWSRWPRRKPSLLRALPLRTGPVELHGREGELEELVDAILDSDCRPVLVHGGPGSARPP